MVGRGGIAGFGFSVRGAVAALLVFAVNGDAAAEDAPLDPFSVTQAVRLARMRADVAAAKLKVGYPGKCYEPTEEEMKWRLDEFTPKARKVSAVLDYYDVGEETIGYVEAKGKTCPRLYVGESIAEMRSTDKSGFEQTTEMREVSPGLWRSVVPLALRYFRFVGAVEDVKFLEHVDSSLVLKGKFSSMDPKVDSIWRAAARTVFLCSRHFIVDGVKRDRLPWAGDLSVSLLANAYTYADAETAIADITGEGAIPDADAIPRCVYTDPGYAAVGLTPAAAKEKGFDPEVKKTPFSALGMAHASRDTRGACFAVSDKKSGACLGFFLVGTGGHELIDVCAFAVSNGWKREDWERHVAAHPTLSEIIRDTALR